MALTEGSIPDISKRASSSSPPMTPSHGLPVLEQSSIRHGALKRGHSMVKESWIPLPLRACIWVPFVLITILCAIGLEIAFHFSNKRQGWATNGDFSNTAGVMHYVYTLPPVAVAAVIAALWAATDISIKKLQPYVDLVHGDSPPQRSLLLDYTRTNTLFSTPHSLSNRHYLVFLTSLLVLVSLTFQPLSAALLVVRDVWWTNALGDVSVTTTSTLGLNQAVDVDDLTAFLAASGYASASIQYSLPDPPWVNLAGGWTVTAFDWPADVSTNNTVLTVNTTAVKTTSGCQSVDVQMTQLSDGSGWNNSASLQDGCSMSWFVDHRAETLFGTSTLNCTSSSTQNAPFSPIVLWFFTYQPSAMSRATFCYPAIEIWNVEADVDFDASGRRVKAVRQLETLTSAATANISGPPLDGRAYNGISFNLTGLDAFALARLNATQLTLPAAVYQAALLNVSATDQGGDDDVAQVFQQGDFAGLGNQVYLTYLTVLAKTLYFLPNGGETLPIQVTTITDRLFLSDVATHLLAAALLLVGTFAAVINLLHRYDRRDLHLIYEPGTIASTVTMGAQTGMADLLAGARKGAGKEESRLDEVLKNKKFRYDTQQMKIVMEGEDGYEWERKKDSSRLSRYLQPEGEGVINRRQSIFQRVLSSRRGSGFVEEKDV